ncbi:hypothetical protein [Microbacterium halotolerans]|uniref:hypothetical protein n=1 Tax=Microbacterium halotolerans TaxID=246613 RepID=UPI001968AA74|nr:hypothetical protein [Microbacterium halotolerans]
MAAILMTALVIRAVHVLSSPSVNFTDLGLTLQGIPAPQPGSLPEHVEELSSINSAMTVSALPNGIRWLLVCQVILEATLGLGMCLAAFILPRRLLAGRPFARSAVWSLFVVCIAVLLSGMAAPIVQAITEAETLMYISGDVSAPVRDTGFLPDGAMVFGLEIDLAPLGIALGLAALLAAFEAGAHLQKDTEGLV